MLFYNQQILINACFMTIKDFQTFDLFGGGGGSVKAFLISTTDASRTVHRLI